MKSSLFITILCACAPAAFADPAEDVRCREIAFSQSVEAQDLARFRSFIDDDARFVGNAVSRGPTAIADAWSVFFTEKGPQIKWRPQFVEVLEDGKLALTRGPYRMVTTDEDGKKTSQWGTFNSVWRMQADDEWRVVFDAGSPANEAPPEEIQALLEQEEPCDQGSPG